MQNHAKTDHVNASKAKSTSTNAGNESVDYTESAIGMIASVASLHSVSRILSAFPNTDELMRITIEEALKISSARRGFIAIVDYHAGELSIRWTSGEGWTDEKRSVRFKLTKEPGKGIEGYVALTGEPYLSGNLQSDPYHCPIFGDSLSRIVVPLRERSGKVMGVLSVNSDRYNAFDYNDLRIIQSLADVAALAISSADYYAREQKLIELGKELALQTDINALFEKVVSVAVEILRADDCSLFIVEDGSKLTLKASKGALREKVDQAAYEIGEGLTGWVAQHGEPICIWDVRSDPRWRGRFPELPPEEIGAFLAVPVMGQKGCKGVLRAIRKRPRDASYTNPFTQDDQNLLYMLASQVGAALDRVELQERLIEAERMAAFGEMSARAAHMLGNKLFALKGALKELRLIQSTLDGERERLHSAIERLIQEMEELLQELKYFVKSARVERKPIELISMLREFVEHVSHSTGDLKIKFETQLVEAWIEGDAERLKRCIGELIENATHFTPPNGMVTIKVEQSVSGNIVITVADTGSGVPDEDKERIFDPFYSTRAQGLGLGLAIVKGIIQAHGGAIEEKGRHGEGAKFIITLPVMKAAGESIPKAGVE